MATQLDFFVALVMGIGPALFLMWFSLRKFDKPFTQYTLFDDRRVFGNLAVGLIFGVIASWLEGVALSGISGTVVALAFFFLFEESFKLAYLNRKGYRGRFDTTFYGVSLGVGAAATAVVSTVAGQQASVLYSAQGAGLLVLLSFSLCLVNADTGAFIAFGSAHGDTLRSFLKALAIRYGHGALLFPYLLASSATSGSPEVLSLLSFVGIALSAVLAGIVYHYVYTNLLPGTLPDDIRREMRRERRRARTVRD